MKELEEENGTFWKNQNLFFFVVLENLTLLSETFTDRWANGPEEKKVLPRTIWSAFRKTGMDWDLRLCLLEQRCVGNLGIHIRSGLFLCFFISSDCVYCTWTFLKRLLGLDAAFLTQLDLSGQKWRIYAVQMRAGVRVKFPAYYHDFAWDFPFFLALVRIETWCVAWCTECCWSSRNKKTPPKPR